MVMQGSALDLQWSTGSEGHQKNQTLTAEQYRHSYGGVLLFIWLDPLERVWSDWKAESIASQGPSAPSWYQQ